MIRLRCSRCDREAKVSVPHLGLSLCDRCFIEHIRERVRNEVKRYSLLDKNDVVLMGVSGGKDSFVLLDILSLIHDPDKLIALTIIEGIYGYNRSQEIELIRKASQERGVEHITTSLKEAIGHSLEELVAISRERKLNISPCTFCGSIRRRVLNQYARELGATKAATAHNLDDEVQTFLINLLRGDVSRIIRQHPLAPVPSEKLVKRIKPLRKIYEREVVSYAYFTGYKFQEADCPYIIHGPTIRARIRRWMMVVESERAGAMLGIMDMIDEIAERYYTAPSVERTPLGECKLCGEPTSPAREYCKVCELLLKLSLPPHAMDGGGAISL